MPEEKEMIEMPGMVPVEKELFNPESTEEVEEGAGEGQGAGAGEEGGEEGAGGKAGQGQGQEHQLTGQEEEGTEVEPEKAGVGQQPKPAEPGRMFAGKYKTEEDLRHAFINLGGNPNKYKTIEGLEEAYEVRQQEFSRSRAEEAERRRISQNIEDRRATTPGQGEDPSNMEALLDKVDWSKVENARDLGRELIQLMSQIVPKNQPNLPSEAELVEKMLPIMKEREERTEELRGLETDIPRLRKTAGQENPFRDAFARHVMAEKQTGSFVNLRTSMRNFLSWGKEIAEEAGRMEGIRKDDKAGAAPISDRGAGLPKGGPADVVDEIIGSYKARKDKLGEI